MSRRSSSRSLRQRSNGAGNECFSARASPPSRAAQHMTFEWTKCRGAERTSQKPRSGSRLFSMGLDDGHQKIPVVLFRSYATLAPAPGQLHDEAVHIELKLLTRAISDAHGSRATPAF